MRKQLSDTMELMNLLASNVNRNNDKYIGYTKEIQGSLFALAAQIITDSNEQVEDVCLTLVVLYKLTDQIPSNLVELSLNSFPTAPSHALVERDDSLPTIPAVPEKNPRRSLQKLFTTV